eukprot:6228703-Prymnesium_polylepis.1
MGGSPPPAFRPRAAKVDWDMNLTADEVALVHRPSWRSRLVSQHLSHFQRHLPRPEARVNLPELVAVRVLQFGADVLLDRFGQIKRRDGRGRTHVAPLGHVHVFVEASAVRVVHEA